MSGIECMPQSIQRSKEKACSSHKLINNFIFEFDVLDIVKMSFFSFLLLYVTAKDPVCRNLGFGDVD